MRLLLKNGFVYQNNRLFKQDIAIQDGVITGILKDACPSFFDSIEDFSNCYILPGFADAHVHLREPGFSYKETIQTGTLAAASGGFTAVCAMPNLNPAPDSKAHLQVELDLILNYARIPVYPYGTITKNGAGETLANYKDMEHAIAFTDDGKGVQDDAVMLRAMQEVGKTGKRIAAHCEDERYVNGYIHDGSYAKQHHHAGISSKSEWLQVKRDIDLVRKTGCPYHVCHVSTKESVDLIRRAKAEGLPVSCEATPHHIALTEQDLQEHGRFKMNPPLRSLEDRDAIIEGIVDGTVDMIATDHAPHSFEEKDKGLKDSAMGVVGLETAFCVCYTALVKPGIISLEKLVALMSIHPRKCFGTQQALIEVGQLADLAVVDLNKKRVIDPSKFRSMGKSTPFEGKEFFGDILLTYAGGKEVYNARTNED